MEFGPNRRFMWVGERKLWFSRQTPRLIPIEQSSTKKKSWNYHEDKRENWAGSRDFYQPINNIKTNLRKIICLTYVLPIQ